MLVGIQRLVWTLHAILALHFAPEDGLYSARTIEASTT
jgi:hypothetical protein